MLQTCAVIAQKRVRSARGSVSAYHQAELAKLVERVEEAVARYRAGEIDVYDVDEVIHRYSKAARKLWKFCWSRGSGSHALFAARTLDHICEARREAGFVLDRRPAVSQARDAYAAKNHPRRRQALDRDGVYDPGRT